MTNSRAIFYSICVALFVTNSLLQIVAGDSHDHDDDYEVKGPPDQCIPGLYHKHTPSIDTEYVNMYACQSWSGNQSCCYTDTRRSIELEGSLGLFNYSWSLCGDLSAECEQFIRDEQCFYQCEPMLWYFRIPTLPDYLNRVPVCASYCDRWFDACKDDYTCVEDWLGGYDLDFTKPIINSCPANSQCITFREMYKDGAGICNNMWSTAFQYSNDVNNCTVMSFDGTNGNPNYRLLFPITDDDRDDGVGITRYTFPVVLGLVLISALFTY